MKQLMISIGSFFLIKSSATVSYPSSNMIGHNMAPTTAPKSPPPKKQEAMDHTSSDMIGHNMAPTTAPKSPSPKKQEAMDHTSSDMIGHNMAPTMIFTAAAKSTPPRAQEATIKLDIKKIEDKSDKKIVKIKLTDIKDNKPVTLQDLQEAHTQKVHLLIIDDALEDYSHIHPKALRDPGVYQFEWNPKKEQANYRVWADLFPVNLNKQEYVISDLISSNNKKAKRNQTTILKNSVDGYSFAMDFETKPLYKGKGTMGKIIVTDPNKNPVKNLEPIMGAFAHIVGFSNDFKTVTHLHPMGKEPSNTTDRGGPKLEFHIEPAKIGFLKIFAQVKINGKELFVPFGVTIKKEKLSDLATTQVNTQKPRLTP